jgi:hypothetical protein
MLNPEDEAHARLMAQRAAEILRGGGCVYPEYLSPGDASVFLGIAKRTLENWRMNYPKGRQPGPRFSKLNGRVVRYRVRDLIDWMERHACDAGAADATAE